MQDLGLAGGLPTGAIQAIMGGGGRWLEWSMVLVRLTPYPVMVTTMDNKDYIRVLLYSYYTTITGWGILLRS